MEGGGQRVECLKSTSRRVGFIANDTAHGHDNGIRGCGRSVAMINREVQDFERPGWGPDNLLLCPSL